MGLPSVNKLIPNDFSILTPNSTYSEIPKLLKQWPDADLWYRKDDKFKKPKGIVTLKLYTTDLGYGSDPVYPFEPEVFSLLWASIQEEYLREFTYLAT